MFFSMHPLQILLRAVLRSKIALRICIFAPLRLISIQTLCSLLLVIFSLASPVIAAEPPKKKTICLNMIVKNESTIITKCLSSVLPIIDYWIIVDTGSTDNTQGIIREFLRDIPGELHERPWVDFAHNRNEALTLAKGKADYILIIDADDTLVFSKDFVMPELTSDAYTLTVDDIIVKYERNQIIANRLDWKWMGVLHEYLYFPGITSTGHIKDVVYKRTNAGARSKDPEKYLKDAQVLEKALLKDPTNSRYMFYLAQSYKLVPGSENKAIEAYNKRTAMGGWDQEIFWSLLQIAMLQEKQKLPSTVFSESYHKAFLYRPTRAEPLYYLASYHRQNKNYFTGYQLSQRGLKIPLPKDNLFVERWIYDYAMQFEYSICAYYVGKYEEAFKASQQLLNNPSLPENYRQSVEANLKWITPKLK